MAAALLHAIWTNKLWRSTIFLCFNLLFVASFTTSPMALLPFALFLSWGYLSVRLAGLVSGTAASAVFVLGTLIAFCWLKNYWFLSFIPFLPFPYLTIGLSYAFFRIMGMIIDARSDPQIARIGPVDFFNFAMNFPTVIAGPIDRYQTFSIPPEPVTLPIVGHGLERIAIGLFKVMVLSALLSTLQNAATAALLDDDAETHRILASIVSFGVYPIYLYFNFSGYTDIVIGIGRLFGKTYPENFNAPFSAYNFIDFWSRWHMTLSTWLRDYVYTPLLVMMMRRNASKALDPFLGAIAYFVTFLLIGLWHGSTVIFAIYGLLLALGVSVNKLFQVVMAKAIGRTAYRELSGRKAYRFAARGLTYTWYAFCMVCFWSTGAQALHIVNLLGSGGLVVGFIVLFVVASVLLNVWDAATVTPQTWLANATPAIAKPYLRASLAAGLVFACVAIVVLTNKVNSDVVYQAF
jgi:alginate O-acetyltransferase complex protein AlgI